MYGLVFLFVSKNKTLNRVKNKWHQVNLGASPKALLTQHVCSPICPTNNFSYFSILSYFHIYFFKFLMNQPISFPIMSCQLISSLSTCSSQYHNFSLSLFNLIAFHFPLWYQNFSHLQMFLNYCSHDLESSKAKSKLQNVDCCYSAVFKFTNLIDKSNMAGYKMNYEKSTLCSNGFVPAGELEGELWKDPSHVLENCWNENRGMN